ncbi:MAG: U32 family peptidase [Oscillibacter sp.]|nr:U32 family peptidase [Oscillibacter sp.]
MTPELLAPAGSPAALQAALDHGADAVYLAWGAFNARRGAQNFSEEEFAKAISDCHLRGVRVFLTLNILLSDRELPAALEAARTASRLGVDAVLLQDWGLFRLLRQVLPDLPLHASTQMSLFTSGGANEVAGDGCERVVLARECSAGETAAICRNCFAEIEVFIHGALCMCYSGQCSMSAILGGRSGNRGRCAQPCRLPYGVNEPAGKKRPLSLKDNCLAPYLGQMEDMGVACLKIEGRMRRPSYAAAVTEVYARLLREKRVPTEEEQALLEQAFSRSGFTDAYWMGRKGSGMFGFRPETASALLEAPPPSKEERRIPVRFSCRVEGVGIPTLLTAKDEDGHTVTVTGAPPEAARNRSLTAEDLAARLGKTGGTPYRCAGTEALVEPGLSLSAAAVNALRRDALAALSAVRTAPPSRRECFPPPPLPEIDKAQAEPQFTISVASAAQLTGGLLDFRPARVYVPLELLAELSALPEAGTEWCALLPRVWRDQDEDLLRRWLDRAKDLGVTGALLGNLGHLPLVRGSGLRLYGDYGLNVFNSHALAYLRDKGLDSACLSFELRFSQMRDLQKLLPAEAIIYGRLPLMITENCLMQTRSGCRCHEPNFLQDRTGAAFPLLPAFGHRTEIQNSRCLWLADRRDWRHLGLAYARLRFTTESPAECVQVCRGYQEGTGAAGEFTRGLYLRGVE